MKIGKNDHDLDIYLYHVGALEFKGFILENRNNPSKILKMFIDNGFNGVCDDVITLLNGGEVDVDDMDKLAYNKAYNSTLSSVINEGYNGTEITYKYLHDEDSTPWWRDCIMAQEYIKERIKLRSSEGD